MPCAEHTRSFRRLGAHGVDAARPPIGFWFDGPELFDVQVFSMSALEARDIDPQQRHTLEQVKLALPLGFCVAVWSHAHPCPLTPAAYPPCSHCKYKCMCMCMCTGIGMGMGM